MSEMRQTQLLEQYLPILVTELIQGYTSQLVTAAAAGTEVVKAAPGKVARISVLDAAVTVSPKDGDDAAWGALTSAAEFDLAGTPMQFNTNISLEFDGPGRAFILYK